MRLEIVARDAETGNELRSIRCALVAPPAGEVYARFEGAAYRGERRPRSGDELLVYRRGYDLSRTTLGKEAGRSVLVRLRRARRECELRLVDDEGPADPAAAGWRLQVLAKASGRWRETPIRDGFEIVPGRASVALRRGAGVELSLLATCDAALVWPVHVTLRDQASLLFRLDRGRSVVVRLPDGLSIDGSGSVECMPDLLWSPVDRSPLQVDAWRWHLNGPGWLDRELLGVRGTAPVRVLPDIPFHLALVWKGTPIYRHVAIDTLELDLRSPAGPRILTARPIVNGRPVPEGTYLASGRLDLAAMAVLADRIRSLAGFCVETPPIAAAWPRVRLPAAEWITALHPRLGLAHLRWPDAIAAPGTWYPGFVAVRLPPGWSAEGTVSLFPVWKGTGAVRTAPPGRLLRRDLSGRTRLRFGGLVPGRYGLDVRLRAKQDRTGILREVGYMEELDLSTERPFATHELMR